MSNYIFENTDDSIKFIGDFESLYKSEEDPWEQSAIKSDESSNEMGNFYKISRHKLLDFIEPHANTSDSICECGCGTGHVTKSLALKFSQQSIYGCDISKTAIKKASDLFNDIDFFQHDILSSPLPKKYNFLILSNILWYVIHDFENLINNSLDSLDRGKPSYLIVQNALFKSEQKYCKEIVDSIGTLTDLFVKRLMDCPKINNDLEVDTKFIRNHEMHHDFGLLLIRIPKI